jgi:hypothetical protein
MDSIEANLQSKLKASKQRARMLEKLNKKKEESGVVDLKSIEMKENKEGGAEMDSRTIEEILKSFSEDTEKEKEKPKVKSKGKGKGKKKKN